MALRTLLFGVVTAFALVIGSWFVVSLSHIDAYAHSSASASLASTGMFQPTRVAFQRQAPVVHGDFERHGGDGLSIPVALLY
ncbi:MAG TPA: hypothetical protein VF286_01435 [Acidiphilium sp.]